MHGCTWMEKALIGEQVQKQKEITSASIRLVLDHRAVAAEILFADSRSSSAARYINNRVRTAGVFSSATAAQHTSSLLAQRLHLIGKQVQKQNK